MIKVIVSFFTALIGKSDAFSVQILALSTQPFSSLLNTQPSSAFVIFLLQVEKIYGFVIVLIVVTIRDYAVLFNVLICNMFLDFVNCTLAGI